MTAWPLYVDTDPPDVRKEWEILAHSLDRRLHYFTVAGGVHPLSDETLRVYLHIRANEAQGAGNISDGAHAKILQVVKHGRRMMSQAA